MASKRPTHYDSRVMKPIKTVVDDITFDSQFEASVYQHLKMFGNQIRVERQIALSVLPKSDLFPELFWKVDFAVYVPGMPYPLYIEAKGVFNRELKLILQALSHTNPSVCKRCLFVSSQGGINVFRGCKSVDMDGMMHTVRSLISEGLDRFSQQHHGRTIN